MTQFLTQKMATTTLIAETENLEKKSHSKQLNAQLHYFNEKLLSVVRSETTNSSRNLSKVKLTTPS